MKGRIGAAMIAYGALAVAAGLTLDTKARTAVWLFLLALAVKTWIAAKRAE